MSNADLLVAGDDYLALGADQYTSAQKIAIGKYVSSENTICRGGIVQTRPGSKSLITLPDGLFQGVTLFKPASGIPHLVAAVSGKIYVSSYPFTSFRQLTGLQFSITAPFMAWSVCFTELIGTFFESFIQDRTQWFVIFGFQKDILLFVGCVSVRSIVSQYGML